MVAGLDDLTAVLSERLSVVQMGFCSVALTVGCWGDLQKALLMVGKLAALKDYLKAAGTAVTLVVLSYRSR